MMKEPKILMLLDNEFTGDMRVENEVFSLVKAGKDVTVLCLNHGTKESSENYCGAKIKRISISLFRKNKMKAFMNTPLGLWESFWWKHIKEESANQNFDFIHAHDLYMVPIALQAKKNLPNNPKIVADLHENFSEAVKHYKHFTTFPGNFIKLFQKWEAKEKTWLKSVDLTITVIEEAIKRYRDLGVPESKICVIPNYINVDHFSKLKTDKKIIDRFKDKFVISYVGGFDNHRGLQCLLKGFKIAYDKTDGNIHLMLVGNGIIFDELNKLASSLGVTSSISFEGWQPPEKLASFIGASDVCTIPHKKTAHTDNTIPHKLFHYMYFNKPVISTNCIPLERIINETETGLIYESENEEDLAKKIVELYSNEDIRKKFGENGANAIETKYNWNESVKPLVQFYAQG